MRLRKENVLRDLSFIANELSTSPGNHMITAAAPTKKARIKAKYSPWKRRASAEEGLLVSEEEPPGAVAVALLEALEVPFEQEILDSDTLLESVKSAH